MTEADLPALPPPPPLSNPPTADEHDRMMRYVSEVRARKELLSLDAWRTRDLEARAKSESATTRVAEAQETLVKIARIVHPEAEVWEL